MASLVMKLKPTKKLAEINKSPEELKKVKHHKQREMILRIQKEIDLSENSNEVSKEAEQKIALELSKTDEFTKMTLKNKKISLHNSSRTVRYTLM